MFKKTFTLALAVILLSSCKIRYSTSSGGNLNENIKTFSIEQFTNQATLGPSTIGLTFTEKLRELFQSQTKLELVSTNGDLSYEGTISDYNIRPIALQGDQTAAQNRLTISIKVTFVNQIETKDNFEKTFSRFADYSSTTDISSVQDGLIEEIFDQLTQDIYDKTLGDW
ncbi:LPS assembly lipoprotein LptE [Flavobacteriales bacterium]|nr:LPS assembly lipoprotein LptE [Flavobacteriales bacterium]